MTIYYRVYQGTFKRKNTKRGYVRGAVAYIGTTIQADPKARFRLHKFQGKDLNFTVTHIFNSPKEMLNKEFELIQALSPPLNKIVNRPQHYTARLTIQDFIDRCGDTVWCQECLHRRSVASKVRKCNFC